MTQDGGRISRAVADGLILPDSGPILLWHPPAGAELPDVAANRLVIIQPMKPDYDHWQARGLTTHKEPEECTERAMLSVVYLPRARALAELLIIKAEAWSAPGAPVLLDGLKTDGIESAIRGLGEERIVTVRVSRAHGKLVAWAALPRARPEEPRTTLGNGGITRPGLFSADGPDPGSTALLAALPPLKGRVADLGAGWGYLAMEALRAHAEITAMDLIEADWRAVQAANEALHSEPRARMLWEDATRWRPGRLFDAVLCNPPFHTSRKPDPSLGLAFIATASAILTPRGRLFLVANRHLPYEALLKERFKTVEDCGGASGYKIVIATAPITPPPLGRTPKRDMKPTERRRARR